MKGLRFGDKVAIHGHVINRPELENGRCEIALPCSGNSISVHSENIAKLLTPAPTALGRQLDDAFEKLKWANHHYETVRKERDTLKAELEALKNGDGA